MVQFYKSTYVGFSMVPRRSFRSQRPHGRISERVRVPSQEQCRNRNRGLDFVYHRCPVLYTARQIKTMITARFFFNVSSRDRVFILRARLLPEIAHGNSRELRDWCAISIITLDHPTARSIGLPRTIDEDDGSDRSSKRKWPDGEVAYKQSEAPTLTKQTRQYVHADESLSVYNEIWCKIPKTYIHRAVTYCLCCFVAEPVLSYLCL